jgi:hypothetical protein
MTNPALPWFSLEFENPALRESYEATVWLEEVGQQMLQAYGQSNAYQAFHELYLSLVAFATGCLYVEEHDPQTPGFNGFVFQSLPIGSYVIEDSQEGRVDTVMRALRLSARQLLQKFGPQALGETARKAFEDPKKRDEPRTIIHVVTPRAEGLSVRPVRLAQEMPFASLYIDQADKKVLQESGYEEFPFFVPRWSRIDQSPWGFGLGHTALPDVKSLNKVKELGLKALPMHLWPPTVTDDDSVIGRFDYTPGAVNTVRAGARLEPLRSGGNPQLVELKIEELKQAIRRIFYIDQLSAIPDEKQMTAFEVANRIEEMQTVMGPTFARSSSELFDPLSSRTFGIMLRAGAFPMPPMEVLVEAAQNRGRIRVKYEGPLARAQRQGDIEAMQRFYGFGAQIAQGTGDVSVWAGADHDEAMRHAAEVLGVPKQVLRDRRQVARFRQQQAAVAERQQLLEEEERASQVARNVTPLLKEVGEESRRGGPGRRQSA